MLLIILFAINKKAISWIKLILNFRFAYSGASVKKVFIHRIIRNMRIALIGKKGKSNLFSETNKPAMYIMIPTPNNKVVEV